MSLAKERGTEIFICQIQGLTEDKVYKDKIAGFIHDAPKCAQDNFTYAFLEMLNNAIEHSQGREVKITLMRDECTLFFSIADDGVGIFSKVAGALNLDEKRYAILELAKGKFTTEPQSHTGEGIFFSSKCGDFFSLASDGIEFFTDPHVETLLNPLKPPICIGTKVSFSINMTHKQTLQDLFKQYTDIPESYGFTKTRIPIHLLEYGDKTPVFMSRSQARRLMARVEKFNVIMLDFSGIDYIGQGFADEIFRVFKANHTGVDLLPINCTEDVLQMIQHVAGDGSVN